ncbi:unnamed protein product, partial [Mesorhabditis belari]|uniref:Nematode cuticle collagen N-terminal domain-containing protein n=1 Tax=Mesorhabditis belari TaxID=2138241 RepID=A0AAF3FFK3_9BILA
MDVDMKIRIYRVIGYLAVTCSTIAILCICVALPIIYNQVYSIRQQVHLELEQCKNSVRFVWNGVKIFDKSSTKGNRTTRDAYPTIPPPPPLSVYPTEPPRPPPYPIQPPMGVCESCCTPGPPGPMGSPGAPGQPGQPGSRGQPGNPGRSPKKPCLPPSPPPWMLPSSAVPLERSVRIPAGTKLTTSRIIGSPAAPILKKTTSFGAGERFARHTFGSPGPAGEVLNGSGSGVSPRDHHTMLGHMASGSATLSAVRDQQETENRGDSLEPESTQGDRYGSDAGFNEDVEGRLPLERNAHKNSVREPIPDAMLKLNIGGSSYRIRSRSIVKFGPKTLLGRFVRMNHEHRRQWADWYFEDTDEYFFERVPRYFDPIYDFFATGKLHVPKDLCFDKFMAELRFWAVSKSKMDDCCSPFTQYAFTLTAPSQEKDHFIGVRCAKLRRRLWLVLEGHTNSKWWKVFEVTSTSFVVLSVAALILGSIPQFQVPQRTADGEFGFVTGTYPTYPAHGETIYKQRTVIKEGPTDQDEMVEHPVFNYVENICVVYFSLEYALRFWVAPRKLAFARQFLNVIDLLSIAPFLIEMLLILVGISGDNVRKVRWAFLTVRLLRVLRVIRIAKLGRFSPGLANFALTIRKSKKQMQMVGVVMATVVIFFSTLIYFLERDEPGTKFTSIPAAFWWSVVTMATVGYGDLVPVTVAGKLVGSGAIVCGVMVLALPITIMVNNFMQVVKLREEKIIKKYAQAHGDQGNVNPICRLKVPCEDPRTIQISYSHRRDEEVLYSPQ